MSPEIRTSYPHIKSIFPNPIGFSEEYRSADIKEQKRIRGIFIKNNIDDIEEWVNGAHAQELDTFGDDKKEMLRLVYGSFLFGVYLVLTKIGYLSKDDELSTGKLRVGWSDHIKTLSFIQGDNGDGSEVEAIVINPNHISNYIDLVLGNMYFLDIYANLSCSITN